MSTVSSYKKCPSCGKLSPWDTSEHDICKFCGAKLTTPRQVTESPEEESGMMNRWSFTEVKTEDPIYLVFFKHIGWGIQIVFTAILSFFMWLIATIAG
jgi:hypothetical protein